MVARKVRELLRRAICSYRCLTERSQSTPCRCIVNINVGRQSALQAIHQAKVHDVIHSAMTAGFARHFSVVFPEGMLILLFERFDALPVFLLLAVLEDPGRIIGERTL